MGRTTNGEFKTALKKLTEIFFKDLYPTNDDTINIKKSIEYIMSKLKDSNGELMYLLDKEKDIFYYWDSTTPTIPAIKYYDEDMEIISNKYNSLRVISSSLGCYELPKFEQNKIMIENMVRGYY